MAIARFSFKDDASFLENILKALKWLFLTGMRGQQLSLILALEPSVVRGFPLMGEGGAFSNVVYQRHLFKDLQPHISETNSILRITLKLVFRSTMVLTTLLPQAHSVPFIGLLLTYVPQMASTKVRSNSPSESQCSACISLSWVCHSTASISGMPQTRYLISTSMVRSFGLRKGSKSWCTAPRMVGTVICSHIP